MSIPLGVIFDMDGVLVDSYASHFESWRRLAAEEGLTITEGQFAATFGKTSREVIAELWADRGFPPETIAAMDDRKEAHFRELLGQRVPFMSGANELLRSLAAAGFRLAVGSSAPPDNAEHVVSRLAAGKLFEAIVTGADVRRGKPDPQVFLVAAARLRMPPERCAVIEDAAIGVAAAQAAGMAAIGLASTGRTRQQLAAANLVVDRLEELSPARIEEVILSRLTDE